MVLLTAVYILQEVPTVTALDVLHGVIYKQSQHPEVIYIIVGLLPYYDVDHFRVLTSIASGMSPRNNTGTSAVPPGATRLYTVAA